MVKQAGKSFSLPSLFIDAFKTVLTSTELDPALIADMFEFISESGAMELFDCVDIEVLHQARNFIIKQLATELQSEFVGVYSSNQSSREYQPHTADIAQRKLANCALLYIAKDSILALSKI